MRRAAFLWLLLLSASPCGADEPRRVAIRLLGGSMRPLEGVTVTPFLSTGDYTDDKQRPLKDGVTDESGAAAFRLAPGRYFVELLSAKALPYLDLPVGYKGHPSHHDWTIQVGAARAQEFDLHLAEACKLTLKAVDDETGEGLPGVVFVTENATAEMWALAIAGDNLGAARETDETQRTDAKGVFTRLVGPRPGFTYYAWPRPEGYDFVAPAEVEIPTDIGTTEAGHVFRFRKKK